MNADGRHHNIIIINGAVYACAITFIFNGVYFELWHNLPSMSPVLRIAGMKMIIKV